MGENGYGVTIYLIIVQTPLLAFFCMWPDFTVLIGFILCINSSVFYSSSAAVRIRYGSGLQELNQPRSTPIHQSEGPIQIHIEFESTLELQIDSSPIRSLGLTLGGCRLAFGMETIFGRKKRHHLLTWLAENDRSMIQSDSQ